MNCNHTSLAILDLGPSLQLLNVIVLVLGWSLYWVGPCTGLVLVLGWTD